MSRRRDEHGAAAFVAAALAVVLGCGLVAATGFDEPAEPPPQAAGEGAAVPVVPVETAPPPAAPPAGPAPQPSGPPGELDPAVPLAKGWQSLGLPPGPVADLRPARTAAPQDRYAFLVGITDYPAGTTDTIGSANDVRFLAQLLVANGWPAENLRVLTDRQVTGAAVREGMAWLAERSQPGTFTLFHYSGHVRQRGGGREALWPADRDWVDDAEVAGILGRGAGKLWVDIAGCEAGSFLPGLPSDRVLVSTSSTATEKSYEYPDWGMSVWSGLVLDFGLRRGGADADRDGRTTIGEALRYATWYAQAITLQQRPYGRQTPQVEGDPVRGWTLADPPA